MSVKLRLPSVGTGTIHPAYLSLDFQTLQIETYCALQFYYHQIKQ